ncbi:hypothetical protein QBC46DRAFT_430745 [Diplogelasinospora grovesii]|uniref:Uncharacterized protein n=1 Tax=Diplogelasinospora grovesii TaxID=303347 RepID=A0AAN6MVL9_9PEZI|nr:hypothetical protein QBC46DRAFT_430745 [Diplogelasinospora grovesii]
MCDYTSENTTEEVYKEDSRPQRKKFPFSSILSLPLHCCPFRRSCRLSPIEPIIEHVEVSDSTVDNTVIHPSSPDKRPSSFAKAPLASTATAGTESVPPPSRDLTTNHTSISQENLRSDILSVSPAYSEITPKLVIKEIIVGGGDVFLFRVGLSAPIWLRYEQLKGNYYAELFLKNLTEPEWRKFLLEREKQSIAPSSLYLGTNNQEMQVEKILQMKLWGGTWMFKVDTTLECNMGDIETLGLADDAVMFCRAKERWRQLRHVQ